MKEIKTRDLIANYAKGKYNKLFDCNASCRKYLWEGYSAEKFCDFHGEWVISLNPKSTYGASTFERELQNVLDLLKAVRNISVSITLKVGSVAFYSVCPRPGFRETNPAVIRKYLGLD